MRLKSSDEFFDLFAFSVVVAGHDAERKSIKSVRPAQRRVDINNFIYHCRMPFRFFLSSDVL
jgi:hypothetical protein